MTMVEQNQAGDLQQDGASLSSGAGSDLMEEPAGAGLEFRESDRQPGTQVGRYLILDKIGQGGMGVVYKAYDPKLDRRVALKVLRAKERSSTREQRAWDRLLREAQALAQLSHPNVVAVYDVGTLDRDIYITMELVEGRTLRRWLKEVKPSVRQILDVMIAAGRGIVAAHQAKIIHRDIKPGNIMIGDDGRVRVLDFGLARFTPLQEFLSDPPAIDTRESSTGEEPSNRIDITDLERRYQQERPLRTPITLEGVVTGTPGYMAPEQYLGGGLNEKTDQFSFCVTLFEALFGKRPFLGKGYRALRYKVVVGRIDPPPPTAKVPAWLKRVVYRGLSVAEQQRYPSMEALLEELAKDPGARWKKVVAGSAMLLLVGAGFAGAYVLQTRKQHLCEGFAGKMAGVWDAPIQQAVSRRFAATNRPYAADTFDRVQNLLNRRTIEWAAARTDVCEATRVRGEQSEQLLDLRMQCLDRRLSEIRALTDLFATRADGEVVDRAVQAVWDLPDLSACGDSEELQAITPLPTAPEVRSALGKLRQRLDEIYALDRAGKYAEGTAIALQVVEEAARLNYPPIHAEALLELGGLYKRAGKGKNAEEILRRAALAAAAAKNDRMIAEAGMDLLFSIGYQQSRLAEARAMNPMVEVAVARVGRDPLLRAAYLSNLGVLMAFEGKKTEAKNYLEQALAIREHALGPEHLDVATTLNNLGLVLNDLGKPDEALRALQRALDIRTSILGTEQPQVASTWSNLGLVQLKLGQAAAAVESFRHSASLLEKSLGPDNQQCANATTNIGFALVSLGQYEEAKKYYERALATRLRVLGSDHLDLADSYYYLGDLLTRQGKHAEALTHFYRALEVTNRVLGPSNKVVGRTLTAIGASLVNQKQSAQAVSVLERALPVCDAGVGTDCSSDETRYQLARALWDSKQTRPKAIALAHQSREGFAKAGEEKELAKVQTWLDNHRL